jgi:hypothetical protein
MNRSPRVAKLLRVPAAVLLAASLLAAAAGATSLPDPAAPELDLTWKQITARVSCALRSWLDMGLRSLNLSAGSCAIYIRVEDAPS